MKKTFKRVLALACAGIMAVSMLTGCGSKNDGFKNQVTLRIPIYQRATPNGAAKADDNYWTKWVQTEFGDKNNIKVEYVALARGQENELYAQFAAAGNLPTCLFEYDYPDVTLYQSEGWLAEYDVEWFKSIAPTYWAMMEANGLDKYTDIDGANVLLIGERPYGNTNYQFVTFYRQDWLEAVGYTEYPSDPAELLKLYAAIDKAGLGGDHILGGTKVEGNGVDQNYAYRTYPEDKELWASTGDYSVPALSTEAQKKLLKWNNTLYNLGYIDDEYNLREGSEAITDFVSGKVFTYSAYATNNMSVLNDFYAQNPNAKLGVIACNGPEHYSDGSCNAFRPNGLFGEYIGFSATATEDEKKAFAMYLEWMIQPEVLKTLQWGFEGKNYTIGEDGNPVSVADQSALEEQQGHNNNVDMWCLVTAGRTLGDVDKDIMAITPLGYKDSDTFFKQIKKNYEGQLACYKAGLCSPDCRFTVAIEANDLYKVSLASKYAQLRDMIVKNSKTDAEFEANYAKASKEYLEAGYQAIIDEKIKAYRDGKAN